VASNGREIRLARETLREAAGKLKAETGLDLAPTLKGLLAA
jgi:hypothetical protein